MAEFSDAVEIGAPPDVVFEHLVTESGLTSWMGEWADLDPRAGGGFAVDIAGSPVRGRYVEVDRPHRVVVTWGFAGSTGLPPGASTVAFDLTPTADGTRVQVTHSRLPDSEVPGHADGWANYLPRLAAVGAGVDPGEDRWHPGPERPSPRP